MVGLDVVHLAAGAMWLGGIAGLVVSFRSGTEPVCSLAQVVRFSTIAVVTVLVVVGAGLGMAWIVLPSLDDLVTTGYGLALLTKVALVIPVIGLGAYNRRRLVPPMSAGRCRRAGAPARQDRRRRAGDPARRRRRDGRARRPLSVSPRRRRRPVSSPHPVPSRCRSPTVPARCRSRSPRRGPGRTRSASRSPMPPGNRSNRSTHRRSS